jgi:hypothetical protein
VFIKRSASKSTSALLRQPTLAVQAAHKLVSVVAGEHRRLPLPLMRMLHVGLCHERNQHSAATTAAAAAADE